MMFMSKQRHITEVKPTEHEHYNFNKVVESPGRGRFMGENNIHENVTWQFTG